MDNVYVLECQSNNLIATWQVIDVYDDEYVAECDGKSLVANDINYRDYRVTCKHVVR